MLRRLAALLLALCLLMPTACAAAPDYANLATISQFDKRFAKERFNYLNGEYRFYSCGPSSVVNALVATWGLTDKKAVTELTWEMLHLLTGDDPAQIMDFQYMSAFGYAVASDYPTLAALRKDWNGGYSFIRDELSVQAVHSAVCGSRKSHQLLVAYGPKAEERWLTLCQMAHTLYHNGAPDATITIAMLGVGTIDTYGAFRSGTGGHYACLHLNVREFCEEGAVYLLDSFPRAIPGEEFGEGTNYTRPYDFDERSGRHYGMYDILGLAHLERIQPTILRITSRADISRNLLAVQKPEKAVHAYANFLNPTGFLNQGRIFVHIPASAPQN